jgi:hypothetical protein
MQSVEHAPFYFGDESGTVERAVWRLGVVRADAHGIHCAGGHATQR